jgi:integration host factor beta subunit
LTKRELVIQVASKLGLTQNDVAEVVQTMFDTITDTLVDGERLEIRNFGVFEVKARDSRVGRNPRTGEEVPIPEKRVASFKPGKVLKNWVQNGSETPGLLFKDGKSGGNKNGVAPANPAITTPADLSAEKNAG